MARSEEAGFWFDAVYSAIQEIPPGKVTSYAHIARLLGRPQCPRQVGVCLKHLPTYSPTGEHYHHDRNVPWQRVINSKGMISPRGPGSTQRQAAALRREGVRVGRNAMGEFSVEFGDYGWFPDLLPSEEGESESEESGEEGEEEEEGENDGDVEGDLEVKEEVVEVKEEEVEG